jgi:hypothetical protein
VATRPTVVLLHGVGVAATISGAQLQLELEAGHAWGFVRDVEASA